MKKANINLSEVNQRYELTDEFGKAAIGFMLLVNGVRYEETIKDNCNDKGTN